MAAATAKGPMTVGRYAIHGEIASGGMATVHFGRLVGAVGFARTVAVKRLHSHLAKDPEFVAMFLDEARLAARIQHPNVVPTLDIETTNGELFLVMEYVKGETLSRLIRVMKERGERVPPRIAAAIAIGTLHGLHAAHEARDEQGRPLGIVHRDVSPQNVLVGVDGVARVLDFGVAKAVVRLQVTREGQLKGKLAYMAPEQLRSGTVNRLTDVYAAAVLLWESLTTRRLFEAEHEGELLHMIVGGASEPPSMHAPGIPPALDAIAMRGLEADPTRRFQTAREMAIALERGVQVAMPSEVGEWVEWAAREGLRKREQRVAEIESQAFSLPQIEEAPASLETLVAPPRDITETGTTIVQKPQPDGERRERTPSHGAAGFSLSTPVNQTPSSTRRMLDARGELSPRPATAAAKRTGLRVLVIDDSEVILAQVKSALEADGHQVITTSNTVGNARLVPATDLCIIDYHMPGIDGKGVIASLRAAAKSGNHACIFYLYTSDSAMLREHANLGFDGCFTDKGRMDSLVRQVRAVFRMIEMRGMRKRV